MFSALLNAVLTRLTNVRACLFVHRFKIPSTCAATPTQGSKLLHVSSRGLAEFFAVDQAIAPDWPRQPTFSLLGGCA
jgi:hypothetical protein